VSVIFQTAEDGLGDTVKPRLVQSGADVDMHRAIVQGKNNLAPEGQAIGFELDPAMGFRLFPTASITRNQERS